MKDELQKLLDSDTDGLATYEYLANHIDTCNPVLDRLVDNIVKVDLSGQFLVSTARYLNAIDSECFASAISTLIEHSIERDRERRYIGYLLPEIWGEDYKERADELCKTDNNFRRIYKRLFPQGF